MSNTTVTKNNNTNTSIIRINESQEVSLKESETKVTAPVEMTPPVKKRDAFTEAIDAFRNATDAQINALYSQYDINAHGYFYFRPIRRNDLALIDAHHQTPELLKLAIQQDGLSLKYVDHQTAELCELAVQIDGLSSDYVQKKTKKLFKPAVQHIKQNDRTLHYVQKQTNKNCKPAVRQKWK